ncbi:MAG TPA: caspase family protein [Spirochaetota bacterium]|nr:caspase family protein [Spirochaetota bacterium]HQH96722.1 caspase family protein [Spirochaetota bacterium]
MRYIQVISALIISTLAFAAGTGHAARQDVLKRYAVIIGSNNGGPDRVKLRYAVSDAKAVMEVLRKLGGVEQDSGVLLVEPRKERLIDSISEIRSRVITAKKTYARVELIFYYSGHSDEEGIIPGGEKIYYRDIKQAVINIPADVRIAILDSCSSGAFTSVKGGRMRSPFLVDRSHSMKGFAFMTSSSSDEASQESDRIRGSFFTHSLLTGLRGAADQIGDGRITLNEAYQYAYAETLARTEKTLRGPQHPNYYITMSGSGDVVLTEIRRSSSTLVLSKPINGRVFLRDGRKALVAELNKGAGRAVTLGLESGAYTVVNEREGKLYEASVTLAAGGSQTLTYSGFAVVDRESTRSRGDGSGESADGGAAEHQGSAATEVAVQPGGFIDSIVRISLYGGIGVWQGGVAGKEKRRVDAFKPYLTIAYLKQMDYTMGPLFLCMGPEIDIMAPAIRFAGKKRFDLKGIKFGVKARYGYEVSETILVDTANQGKEEQNNILQGRLATYHYWSAGPTMNIVLSPRSNIFNVIVNCYITGGQVFNGRLTGGSVLRGSSRLWLLTAGYFGVPGATLPPALLALQAGEFNATRIKGYTIRGGFGPEICLNKWVPLIFGIHLTYSYTSLTLSRPLPVYFDADRKAAHHELGAELSLGFHF